MSSSATHAGTGLITPFLDVRAGLVELGPELDEAWARVRDGGRYVLGPEVDAFEEEFARFCDARHCIGTGNGLDALALILRAVGIGPGDEVLVPAYTAVATWMAVWLVGATPVGVDVDEATCNIDAAAAAGAVTARTRALVAVHLFGQPADMDALSALAEEHGLELIEDAAQAHGARHRGRRVGGLARAAAFSFYPTKNLGALGDGGAVTTDDEELAHAVRRLRTYGWRVRGESEIKGVNSRLDELQAALLRVKLRRLDAWNERRREIAQRYRDGLVAHGAVRLPRVAPWAEPVWHLFVVACDDRPGLQARLAEEGVGTLVHYDPLPHLTEAFRRDGWAPGSLPVAERLAARALSLPMYPQLTGGEVDRVVAAMVRRPRPA